MNQQLPPPVVCGMCGALAGFAFGNCQIYPVWLGAAIGGSLGCLMCAIMCIAEPVPVITEPIVVQHIHIFEGAPKVIGTNTESDGQSK